MESMVGMHAGAHAAPAITTAPAGAGCCGAPTLVAAGGGGPALPGATQPMPAGVTDAQQAAAHVVAPAGHTAGADGHSMKDRPDLARFSAAQVAEAATLRDQTTATISRYANLDTAIADGYRLPTTDNGERLVHVGNSAYKKDGRVLDPTRPEVLVYVRQPDGSLKLGGAMYKSDEVPGTTAPVVGGGIGTFHSHNGTGQPLSVGGTSESMMHVWMVDDVATAYTQATPPELKPA